MASADGLSAPGSATYDSDTLTVGDGTWDFTKNTFLLPNLVGLNIDTMRYNGMGNRFATLTQYHSLVTAHGVLAAITFLFIVPIGVMYARFHRGPPGSSIRGHAYLQVLAVGLSTVVFILGWFSVGPNRSLTNPHHGIGVAIYTLILLQAIGGRLVKSIRKRSLRLMIHRWNGRAVTILGIVQVPLGLTLYGSPLFTFILYAVWMAFLFLLYFILSYRHEGSRDDMTYGGRSEAGLTVSEGRSKRSHGWLGPLAAGAGIWALLRGRKHGTERSRSHSPSRSRSRGPPEVIPSRRGSASYFSTEKYSDRSDRQGGGLMNKLLGIAGVLGMGAFVKRIIDRRERRRYDDEEYSAVETDTPSRFTGPRSSLYRPRKDNYTESDFSDDRTDLRRDARDARPRTPLLPGPGDPVAAAAALSAAEPRPVTPRPSHARPPHSRHDSHDISSYSSYVSPSRRAKDEEGGGSVGKGLLAGMGLGWFTKKMKDRRDRRADEERMRYEDERRDGRHGSRYTGDGTGTPTRSNRRRPPPAVAPTATTMTQDTESMLESRPSGTGFGGPPMPPLGAPPPPPVPGSHSRSRSRTRPDSLTETVTMPPMPPDPHGVLRPVHHESESDSYMSAGGGPPHRRHSSRRRREGERAAAAAASSAAGLAAEEGSSRRRSHSRASGQPVSVKVKYHDDRDRNVTLRRLTDEEARREHRRRRSNSMSSLSGSDTPTRRRYRRGSSSRKTGDESAAEHLVGDPLSPPTPSFAKERRAGKDSAYYSGQPGPSGGMAGAGQTVSSIDSPESHGTWSGMSPSLSVPTGDGPGGSVATSAADRRRRRRLERRDARPTGTVEFD